MYKGIVTKLVDRMLLEKASFDKIECASGWSKDEIWMYIDTYFRVQHPEFYINNRHYFVWGIDDEEEIVKQR